MSRWLPVFVCCAVCSLLASLGCHSGWSFEDAPGPSLSEAVAAALPVPRVSALASVLIDPASCDGRRLEMTGLVTRRPAPTTVWHLCYTTPDPANDPDMPMPRVPAIDFAYVPDDPLFFRLFGRVAAPETLERAWTSSVLLALPVTEISPRFNVRMDFLEDIGGVVWAVDRAERVGLRALGQFRAWRVASDGRQTHVPLRLLYAICDGLQGPTAAPSGHYVPDGSCPRELLGCEPGPFHCRR